VIEGQLGESILEKDGRLAFSNLAASTINTLLPKMETQGQLGKARWRLVSAPSIPGLLSFDPTSDPFKSITMTTLGTEVEVQFGDKLQVGGAVCGCVGVWVCGWLWLWSSCTIPDS
jgi:hypothetical protein